MQRVTHKQKSNRALAQTRLVLPPPQRQLAVALQKALTVAKAGNRALAASLLQLPQFHGGHQVCFRHLLHV